MINKIKEARKRIKDYVIYTDTVKAEKLSTLLGENIYLKLENMQKAGSFKVRGVTNKLLQLTDEEKKHGVITASAGNHAQGVAIAATQLGIKATIIMPSTAPQSKIIATREYGAEVILHGDVFDDAMEHAKKLQKKSGATFVHPFEDDAIVAGQGTIGLEIMEQLNDVDQVIVPIGGGGLLAGISTAIKEINPKVKFIGVQTKKANPMLKSFVEGKYQSMKIEKSIADGIAVGTPGRKTFEIIKNNVDEIVDVSDEQIASAILFLLEKCKLVTEGAGCVGIAALLNGKIDLKGKKTLVVISGGNIDVTLLENIINKALEANGRRVEIKVNVKDDPNSLSKLLKIIGDSNGNIRSINQGSNRKNLKITYKAVTIVIDTLNKEHIKKIISNIEKQDFEIISY